jgi:diaminopimelate decarboxylase
MDKFEYKNGTLYCENARVGDIAEKVGTPLYIYSRATIEHHYKQIEEAFRGTSTLICYSIKANGNLALLRIMKDLGAGFDAVSGGEIYRALAIGADPKKIVFAGVGKTDEEIRYALQAGILMFNVESREEMENIDRIALEMGRVAPMVLRVNPDVDPKTHTYITTGKAENKFGIDLLSTEEIVAEIPRLKNLQLLGFHCHIGSQITDIEPYNFAMRRMMDLFQKCRKSYPIQYLNIGGGFGIYYKGDEARPVREFAQQIMPFVEATKCRLILEPGRFIVGNAGILVTRVQYIKKSGPKRFVICDAGMNDLIRPTLYQAYHRIWPVTTDLPLNAPGRELSPADVVGPICESGDYFARDRALPEMHRGDLMVIFSAGAYGFTMSSNYNSRPKPPEVLVEGNNWRVVRKRETYEDLVKDETER